MTSVTFANVWKQFGAHTAIEELDLEIKDGEFMVFVGPSGCGKTTTLRMLAGLEIPTFGKILLGDEDVTLTPPGRRNISMVFQSYALYPHMTVRQNLAFGPQIRHENKSEIAAGIDRVANLVGLQALLHRFPSELSGGQRQRVALARSMIRRPRIFLLDEPLSNLDASLRTHMRTEIAELQRQLGVTAVYVTHDQVEAMTMGHRIAVFDHGRILQVATPAELYRAPASKVVGMFIGSPRMNILPARVSHDGSLVNIHCLGTTFSMEARHFLRDRVLETIELGIRPDEIQWVKDAPSRCTEKITGVVTSLETTGSDTFVVVDVEGTQVNSKFPSFAPVKRGDTVDLIFDPADLHFFDAGTGASLKVRPANNN
ncbi:sugar transporter [Rhizobium sp. R634]|uniref:ABC transporter ATP-binding protein n=1 Tax=Rhizobium sp. R634 TaxID=1764274 RepID=UPI000B531820|nr:ABC transporter ATP-binding protein [Rhizobium sp. R634]OWV81692.1 sugar transporter [Rhizobium sp. R634]